MKSRSPVRSYVLTLFSLTLLLVLASAPAFAITPMGGATDPTLGLRTFLPYAQTIAEVVIVLSSLYLGGKAVMEHRSFAPHIVGLMGGTALAFGGPYIMTQMGIL